MIIKNALLIDMNDIYRKYMDIIIRGGKIAGIRNAADGGSGACQNGTAKRTDSYPETKPKQVVQKGQTGS